MKLNQGFKLTTKEPLTYMVLSKWQDDSRLAHCFTTRLGGVSTGYLSSLNLGFNRGDNKTCVMENYQRVCDILDVALENVVLSKQVHEADIVKVGLEDAGNGIMKNSKWASADGMYTIEPNLTLVTHYADCVPLLFYAPGYDIIGMTHAGWRGTVKEIAKKLVNIWTEREQIPVEAIQVAIGPSICRDCFEVGKEVADVFIARYPNQGFIIYNNLTNKYYIDLWECNHFILKQSGIKEDNIFVSEACTSCNEDLFFSHRKTNGKRGTHGAFMALKALGDE